jgi:probable addiction module antidote protein
MGQGRGGSPLRWRKEFAGSGYPAGQAILAGFYKEQLMKRARSHDDELKESLKDPVKAAEYLRVAYGDPDKRVLLLALKDVVEARAGISRIARLAKLDRRHLYVMLSKDGNPEWFSVNRLLNALGIQLSFEPKSHHHARLTA